MIFCSLSLRLILLSMQKYKKEKSQSKKSQKISYIFCSSIFFAYLCPIYSKIF